jgi:hypothetical protein
MRGGQIANGSRNYSGSGIIGTAYFMAFVGAAVYFIKDVNSFWMGVIGFLKALVWPGFLIYKLLEYL